MSASPFHIGEQRVQTRMGVRQAIEPWARQVVRPHLPEQHRAFYNELPFVVAAAMDSENRPWATLLAGPPGFIHSPDASSLLLDTQLSPDDALKPSLKDGTPLGLLGIELDTRRRNRVNGTLRQTVAGQLHFTVGQAFGNCPQYITQRQWRWVDVEPEQASSSKHEHLNLEMQHWISQADTMFLASGYLKLDRNDERFGMDASHRGGPAGFIEVLNDRQLIFPDYGGNNHFNTIGNLEMNPRIGLLFVDFERGSLLQISGDAMIDWDSQAVARHPSAQRLINVDIRSIIHLDAVLPLRWSAPSTATLSLRVRRKIQHSQDVTSFELESRDGSGLPDFKAGQHLAIERLASKNSPSISRSYSLSNAPGQGYYRISVKRHAHGQMSRWLHDELEQGALITAHAPAGEFVLSNSDRPTVLISAGVGLTPMLSMLHQLCAQGNRRPIWFVHAARDGAHHPLADEVLQLAKRSSNVNVHRYFSHPNDEDALGRDYDRTGRLDGNDIAKFLPNTEADYYICGPSGFMADVSASLIRHGVDPVCLYTETFGPVGV